MRPSLRRPASLLPALLFVVLCTAPAAAQKFFPDDPLDRELTPLPAIDPGKRNLSLLLETAAATFGNPGERHPAQGVIAAQGVNSLGEVLDGAWYVNRHGRTRLSLDELRRGAGDAAPPSTDGAWRVLLIRSQSARPTIVFRDSQNDTYLLRFDPASAPELATGADMVASRFFHALGYWVPETYLVSFERSQLAIETNASDITSIGQMRNLLPADIDRLLEPVARRRDGTYRAVALRLPREVVSLLGPFQMFGTRSDDPNDLVPHEHRRELRGLQVFSAWLNHTRMDPLHTIDVVVEPAGEPRHVRHYLFDFMGALGSGITGPKAAWEGREPLYGQNTTIRNIAGLGLYSPAWMRADYPQIPSVGRFDSKTFEPDTWTPVYDVAPFANRLPDDTFWAARQVMAFTDDEIRAIAQVAQYSDPRAAQWIADCLIERRDKIGHAYFSRVLPLDNFATSGDRLTFLDRGRQSGIVPTGSYRFEWWLFDNKAGMPAKAIGGASLEPLVPSGALNAPQGTYVMARVTAEGGAPGLTVNVYLRSEPSGLRIVGLDHEWPNRTLVEPRVIEAPRINRYATLEPERQNLFVTYVRTLNARTGQTLSPAERFRQLPVSEQTTFDGVTHALMRSSLTDERGQALGRVLDLVTGLDRIAGAQSGRGGDQQFRLYVTLRPGARDTLERSREFVRSHENTVYHAGYPHSYRLADSVPSIQFSLAQDGLSADVDVDYRASKAPQALFNGHLTSSNSDVRAGDNAKRHGKRWNGFANWWSDVFGAVPFAEAGARTAGPFGVAPGRVAVSLPPDRPLGASIPKVEDAVQEFFTDWLIRRNYREAEAFFAPDVYACVADSLDMNPRSSPDRLRQAGLELLRKTAEQWGQLRDLGEAMTPILPWNPAIRIVKHAFEPDFAIVEAPSELGAQYECGATPPKNFVPSATPEYGNFYGALIQVMHDGEPSGALVFVWRRVQGEWRLVSYRPIE